MLTIITCLTADHDLRLVLLAALLCTIGTAISIQLLRRGREEQGEASIWPFLAGIAFGASIWSTHFIAMLAYQAGGALSYEPLPTVASLVVALLISTGGFYTGHFLCFRGAPALSGGLVGLGVAAMHYLGMHALSDSGFLQWEPTLVVSSILIGAALGALGVSLLSGGNPVLATVSLVAAICGLHFTGMAALTIQPLAVDPAAVPMLHNAVIACAVAGAAMLILGTGLLAFFIDRRAGHQSRKRLKTLADAAIEGLLVVENGIATDWNRSFERLSGFSRQSSSILRISELIEEAAPEEISEGRVKHTLIREDGSKIPIELLSSSAPSGRQIFAVRDLREKIASETRIHFLAHYDPLTGLPNRLAFLDHLNAIVAQNSINAGQFAVFALDLDRFKEVNDVFGHAMGDRVLREVAGAMSKALQEGEFLARVGGDEFVAVQVGAHQPEGALSLGDRLTKAATARLDLDGNLMQLGVSIGVALYPKDAVTASELMANADLAMYRAKESLSSGACFFSREMDDQIRSRRALARDLREAISKNQLELFYQVQTSLADATVVGFEALLRWNHPEHGSVPPSRFIPIAEESGSIVEIGQWVIETACAQAASWPLPYRVAVNVSGVQFSQGDLPGVVHAALLNSGLSPSRLELEITETVLIADMDRALAILRRLKALGVTIAMDDFGTGYSSLSTLKVFPFDKIKIDRSFIDQVETQAQARSIVRAILALGRSLDIPVLAEGVETSEHLAFLRSEGCQEAQGYLLGRPAPAAGVGGPCAGSQTLVWEPGSPAAA